MPHRRLLTQANGQYGPTIGLGIPLIDEDLKAAVVEAAPAPATYFRWPYRSTSDSAGHFDDSSPDPSSDSSPSESEHRTNASSATHDFLINYLSPSPTQARGGGKKIYLLSSGPRQPVKDHRRCKSESFRFPIPPTQHGLKSALKNTGKDYGLVSASPSMRATESSARDLASPLYEDKEEELFGGRQGWSPYSSAAPTPRQVSFQVDSRSSSVASSTLVSDSEGEEMQESSDAIKLARLHASLYLLDAEVKELPLSLADERSSIEEKMAFLCGLGYRTYRSADEQKMVRAASATSTVPSSCASPILCGTLAVASDEEDADATICPRPPTVESELGHEFSYLMDDALWQCEVEQSAVKESGLMSPPLTTPELGMGEESPLIIEAWPSPMTQRMGVAEEMMVEGCKPCAAVPAPPIHAKVSPKTVTTANSDCISSSVSLSVLSRPRPIPSRSNHDVHSFANKSISLPPHFSLRKPGLIPKSASTTLIPQVTNRPQVQFKIPQRKSSLDIRAQAELARMTEVVIHPNSVCRDAEVEARLYSSASAYLASGASPGEGVTGGVTKSFSMPALFAARKNVAKKKGRNTRASGLSMEVFLESAIGLAL